MKNDNALFMALKELESKFEDKEEAEKVAYSAGEKIAEAIENDTDVTFTNKELTTLLIAIIDTELEKEAAREITKAAKKKGAISP